MVFEAEFEGVDIIDIVGCCVVEVVCFVFSPDVVHCHPEKKALRKILTLRITFKT